MLPACPSCRELAPVGSRFCPSCGTSIEVPVDVTRLVSSSGRTTGDAATQLAGDSSSPGEPEGPIADGQWLGERYRIVRMLGRGGMGAVYEAEDHTLGRPVAIKLLPASWAQDPRRLRQFHNEVSLAREIAHPNVCRVYDIGEASGRLFLSMELVQGEDLAHVLQRRGAMPEAEAVDVIRQICAGLSAIHDRGILHRDLKPANIMIAASGAAKIMDFGLAETGVVETVREGSPAYMAPEQLLGQEATAASDIYALGLVMHELLTGRGVFYAKTVQDLVTLHQSGAAIVPAGGTTQPGGRLNDVVRQCLDRDPAKRPASASAASSMLQVVILDERVIGRRLLQIAIPMLIAPIGVTGIGYLSRGEIAIGVTWVVAALPFLLGGLLYALRWEAPYKGHRIRFENHTIFGERLYIDGTRVDRGRLGRRITLRGTIESGAGAGERITATSTAGFVTFSCRIVSESFR